MEMEMAESERVSEREHVEVGSVMSSETDSRLWAVISLAPQPLSLSLSI